jgi:hypothetical protein
MVNPDGVVALIDHGSAFAGVSYRPATDKNSFIPAYLRAWGPSNFATLLPAERLKKMPRLNYSRDKELRRWLESIDSGRLASVIQHYGIDPMPALTRLRGLLETQGNLSEAVCRFFAGA